MSSLPLPFEEPLAAGTSDADERARVFAVDPGRNVVLEASAGTGKTRVLVDRYVNLLRAGVDPANILAITFTRKAAAEMRQRILTRLREGAAPSEADATLWRDLRERAGEIAISTIDAFCLSLLREFPLEADLEPGFTMADETEIPRFVEQALDRALRVCRNLARQQEPIALVFAQLSERSIRKGLEALLSRRVAARPALARFLERGPADLTAGSVIHDGVVRLRQTLRSVQGGLDAFLASGPLSHRRYEIFRHDVQRLAGDDVTGELDPGWVRAALHRLRQHFFNTSGEPRRQLTPHYVKAQFASDQAYRQHLAGVTSLAVRIGEDIKAFRRDLNVVLSRGVWQMFQIASGEYSRTLEAHAALDFSEVLERAVLLLQQMDEFARSRYRLESRYHHLLVDEFQDTSRAQWDLVSLLVKSWGEGFGLLENAPLRPSVFIVGDRKQSIYGFRDAEVTVLKDAREYIAGLRPDEPARQSIAKSSRAVPALLRFINDVCEEVEHVSRGDAFTYTADDRFPTPTVPQDDQWARESLGLISADSVEACANGVAGEIERLLAAAQVRDRDTGVMRAARCGDVAILFRSRESHREFEAALEARGIPTYVYKGLGFFDADEIKDVVALLRYLANPESHTRSAAFLRSRFVRLSDPGLQALAHDVAGALKDHQPPAVASTLDDEDQKVLTFARDAVARWMGLVDRVPPAELLDQVIAETAYAFELRGPRLAQARENVKKIRAIVRRVQNRGYITLARLAEYLDRISAGDEANAVIDAVNAVTLMTVHAAKGLEFPVVFIVNLGRGAAGPRQPVRVLVDDGTGEPSVSVGEFESEADDDVKARDREESKRLLYVALTRARDRLYLSSSIKDGVWKAAGGGLGDVLPASLGGVLAQAAADSGNMTELEWTARSGATHVMRVCAAPPDTSVEGPENSRTEPRGTHVEDRFEPLIDRDSSERLAVTSVAARGSSPRPSMAEARRPMVSADAAQTLTGRLVHRLLQLGDSGEGATMDLKGIASALIAREELSGFDDIDRVVEEAIRLYESIRNHRDFTALTSDACLFEVPFSFKPPDSQAILRGTIDCLARHRDGRVTVFEFKTGRPHPDHQAQLELYVAAARALFPGAIVEGRVIYP